MSEAFASGAEFKGTQESSVVEINNFFFWPREQLDVGSQFPDQGLNPGYSS